MKNKNISKNFIVLAFYLVSICYFVYVPKAMASIVPSNPGWMESNIDKIILKVTNWFLGFISLITVLAIIWGGVKYTTSTGNPEKVTDAKQTIKYAILGLVVAGLAYAIVVVIVEALKP